MTRIRVFLVDTFTTSRFSGNPAAVLLDADQVPEGELRALARELSAGDTACVLQADASDHDIRVRFLTPRGEAPFIGHASLAVHGVLAALGEAPRPRQKHAGGRLEVSIRAGAPTPRIALTMAAPGSLRDPEPSCLPEVLAALGLTPAQLDERCPPQLAGASGTRLLLGLADAGALSHLRPDMARLAALASRMGAPGVFLFTLHPALAGVHTEARMLCPALGIPEDPVSGNAHVLLAVYLWQQGLLSAETDGTVLLSGAQGHHLGRAGRVSVQLTLEAGQPSSATLIGDTTISLMGTMEL